jgi:hypothetical protein
MRRPRKVVAAGWYVSAGLVFVFVGIPPAWLDNSLTRTLLCILGLICLGGATYEWYFRRESRALQNSDAQASVLFPHDLPNDNLTDSPASHTSFPFFRDIHLKNGQEIPFEERPRPWPRIIQIPSLPFAPKLNGEFDYVAGWNCRLLTNVRYALTYDFGKNEAWPEIEIVLYQRVLGISQGSGLWKRVVSAGAVTSSECASEVTPQSEDWLITCWGKTLIARDAPWLAFVPETYDLDTKSIVLTLVFSAPSGDGEGSLVYPETRSALHMRAMD